MKSLDLLKQGSPKAFIEALCGEALEHNAVHHNFLKTLAAGEFKNNTMALQQYAYNYSFYSSEFPAYVEGAIGSLKNPLHREKILENLEEEKGNPKALELKDRPHVDIFNHFKKAIGVDSNFINNSTPCPTVLIWRDLFLQKCQSRIEGVSIAAMGIATEFVVPKIYEYIIKGIKNHTSLKEDEYLFFTLHSECDDQHSQDMIEVIEELCDDYNVREAVRFGTYSALNLRNSFWDSLYSRIRFMETN